MNNVVVLQCENRLNLEYFIFTQKTNKIKCKDLNYDYDFINIDSVKLGVNPYCKKLYVISNFLKKSKHKVLIFLDSDAWINNQFVLDKLLINLNNSNKNGCFSRDPYIFYNTYINSGSFILKINDYTIRMFDKIINQYESKNHNEWPYDQIFVSAFVYENRENFYVFKPRILNTPYGIVLRHNWCKTKKMFEQAKIETKDLKMNFIKEIDDMPYPNVKREGYKYFQPYHQYLFQKYFAFLNEKRSSLTQFLAFRTRVKKLISNNLNTQ